VTYRKVRDDLDKFIVSEDILNACFAFWLPDLDSDDSDIREREYRRSHGLHSPSFLRYRERE
jgi:hypothetical protein